MPTTATAIRTPSTYLLIEGDWYVGQINDDDDCPVSIRYAGTAPQASKELGYKGRGMTSR